MYTLYRSLTYIFFLITPIYLKLRLIKNKEHPDRYKEKISVINESRGEGFLVWFHAASVGETLSIVPLIEEFRNQKKINKILITTITTSSAEVLKKRFSSDSKIIHQFLPFDVPNLINKFLNHWSPNLSIFVESEIWPNLIFEIKKREIPLLLINARISKKSFSNWSLVSNFSKKIFRKFDLCIVANNESENYLNSLGVKKIKNYGNLKFSISKNINKKIDLQLSQKLKERKVWCAASTHQNEEILCADVHKKLKKIYSDVITTIIPRHISRKNSILKELSNKNLNVLTRKNENEIKENTDILLIDSYGETNKYFNLSKFVFLGGSIIKHGGQNPIEPAMLGCRIYHGRNVSNFSEIYSYLKSMNITTEINNSDELYNCLLDEFKYKKNVDKSIIEKIEKYGEEIHNSVFGDLKEYIKIKL